MDSLKDNVRKFIVEFYDTDNPERIESNGGFQRAKALVAEHLPLAFADQSREFIAEVDSILLNVLGPQVEIDDRHIDCPLDRSWSIFAVDPRSGVGYMVIVCGLFPLVTVRPVTRLVGEGLDNGWPFELSYLQTGEDVETKVNLITTRIGPIAEHYGYTSIHWQDEALQQSILVQRPKKWFLPRKPVAEKAWDFLVYFDYVHG